jgi:hypothetical protein
MSKLTAADGTVHGDRIPGSFFYRSFCRECDEPMRVEEGLLVLGGVLCEVCNPPHRGVGNARSSRLNSPDYDPDAFAKSRSED